MKIEMKKNVLTGFYTTILLLCSFIIVKGQETLIDTLHLEEVIITGTKIAVSCDYIPFTVSVIDKKEIEESSESALLPVLTERIPGMFVTERGVTGFGVATGAAGQITLRGIGSSPTTQVLVLLNGNPQYMGVFGHPLADAYVASDVERVEVIRGPASTLYGSNAMGGVINIITKEQQVDGYKINGRFSYGSYNTQKYMINGGYKKKGFNAFAGINHDQTNGHRDSSDFLITNGYLQLGYKINNHLNARVDFSLADFDATDPGMELGNAGNGIDILRGMGAFVFNNEYEKVKGSLRFFYNFGEHNISDGFHSIDNNYGLVIYEAFQLFKGNSITLGVDYKNYGGMAENVLAMNGAGIEFIDTSIYEIGGYAFIQQKFFSSLMINLGFRLEHHEMYGAEPVPSGGIAWRFTNKTVLKASVAKGFRSPTIRELYMWGTANKNLNPERVINYEASINQYLLRDKLSLEFTAFKTEGENLIKTTTVGTQTMFTNTGELSNWGVEFAASYSPTNLLEIYTNYSYINMENLVIATPEQQLFLSTKLNWKKVSFNLSFQGIFNLYLQTGQEQIKESYTLFNSHISYKVYKNFIFFIKGENLFNQNYQINYDYPMPGITAFVGLNVHIN